MISSVPPLVCAFIVSVPAAMPSRLDGLLLMYVGPDQILPLTSVLGGVIGVLLMFWNRLVGVLHRIKKFYSRR